MQLTTTKKQLVAALERVAPAVPTHHALPILSNVRLVAGKELEVFGSSLSTAIRSWAPADVKQGGSTLVNARALLNVAKSFSEEEIAISATERLISLRCGAASCRLPTLNVADFPEDAVVSKVKSFNVPTGALVEIIQKTQHAQCEDKTREVLRSMRFEFEPNLVRAIATDGHRLAVHVAGGLELGDSHSVDVPCGSIDAILRVLQCGPAAQFAFGGEWLKVEAGGAEVVVSLNAKSFPPWRQVVPTRNNKTIFVGRKALLNALERARAMGIHSSKDRPNPAMVSVSNSKLVVSIHEADAFDEAIPCAYEGEPIQVAAAISYLIDALKSFDEDSIKLELGEDRDPFVFRGDGESIELVMPIRS